MLQIKINVVFFYFLQLKLNFQMLKIPNFILGKHLPSTIKTSPKHETIPGIEIPFYEVENRFFLSYSYK